MRYYKYKYKQFCDYSVDLYQVVIEKKQLRGEVSRAVQDIYNW